MNQQVDLHFYLFWLQVAELKRINNLISDQQFFGLLSIKIPIKKHSFLIDIISAENADSTPTDVQPNVDGATRRRTVSSSDVPLSSDEETIFVRTISIRDQLNGSASKEAHRFLRSMDKDLEKIRQSTSTYKSSLEEVAQTLTCKRFHPIQKRSILDEITSCGIQWYHVVIVILLIAVIVPIIYIVYMEIMKADSVPASSPNSSAGS